jgi:hypothetical protein
MVIPVKFTGYGPTKFLIELRTRVPATEGITRPPLLLHPTEGITRPPLLLHRFVHFPQVLNVFQHCFSIPKHCAFIVLVFPQ